ncbi:MAG: metal ABC transporter permease [Eubacteriales bacterium]
MTIPQTLAHYFSYPFVVNAMIVGILVALCSSLLGATLVLKRFSYIGDGLSHIAFGAIAIATVLDIADQSLLVFPVTALCAVLLLQIGQNAKINGDAAIAMMSVGSLAIGYLLMNIFPRSTNLAGDVCTTLFGSTSILTLTKNDVRTCMILSIIVIFIFILFYHKIFSVTFDETFAKATGIRVGLYNLLIAITIAAVIVVAMNLVGSLLISALVVFPALSSMRLFRNFRSVIVSSIIISVFCAFFGILISILCGTPVGSTIVTANIIVFILASIYGFFH